MGGGEGRRMVGTALTRGVLFMSNSEHTLPGKTGERKDGGRNAGEDGATRTNIGEAGRGRADRSTGEYKPTDAEENNRESEWKGRGGGDGAMRKEKPRGRLQGKVRMCFSSTEEEQLWIRTRRWYSN